MRELSTEKPLEITDEVVAKVRGFLENFRKYGRLMGAAEDRVRFTPSLWVDNDYYTGMVMEVVCGKGAEQVKLCSGGRYDDLHGRFSERRFSGVGASFEFESIMRLMGERSLLRTRKSPSSVLVAYREEGDEKNNAMELYRELLQAGVGTELYLGGAATADQRDYADRKDIRFILTLNAAGDEVEVRRRHNGGELFKTIPIEQAAMYVSNYYEAQ